MTSIIHGFNGDALGECADDKCEDIQPELAVKLGFLYNEDEDCSVPDFDTYSDTELSEGLVLQELETRHLW